MLDRTLDLPRQLLRSGDGRLRRCDDDWLGHHDVRGRTAWMWEPACAREADGDEWCARDEREPCGAPMVRPARKTLRRALGEHPEHLVLCEELRRARDGRCVAGAALDREGAKRVERPSDGRDVPKLGLRHVPDLPWRREGEDPRVEQRLVVRDEDHRSASWD